MNLQEYLNNFKPPKPHEKNGLNGFICTCLANGNLRFNFTGNCNTQFDNCAKIAQHFKDQGINVNIKPQHQNWLVLYINFDTEGKNNNDLSFTKIERPNPEV